MPRLFSRAQASLLVATALFPATSAAVWTNHGVQVSTSITNESALAIAGDGDGGAFVLWTGSTRRIQHLSAGGDPMPGWPDDGVVAPSNAMALAADGSGGVFVLFGEADVLKIVRWTSDGDVVPGWPVAGVALGTDASVATVFAEPDGTGGVLVGWPGNVIAPVSPRVTRVSSSGAVMSGWPTPGFGLQADLSEIEPDGAGGCYVKVGVNLKRFNADGTAAAGWPIAIDAVGLSHDAAGGVGFLSGDFVTHLAYAHRRNADGQAPAGWPANGVLLNPDVDTEVEGLGYTAIDATGGMYATFTAWPDPGGPTVLLSRVGSSGTIAPEWGSGLPIGEYSMNYRRPVFVDSNGNAIVVTTGRDATGEHDLVRAQRVASDGTVLTAADPGGFPLSTNPPHYAPIVSASGGNVIVAWADGRSGNNDVFTMSVDRAQEIDAGWPANGFEVGLGTGVQSMPAICVDAAGNAMTAWVDAAAPAARVRSARVLDTGRIDPSWPIAGVGVATSATGEQSAPAATAAADGNAWIVFEDTRDWMTDRDLWVQSLTPAGVPAAGWPAAGRALSAASHVQRNPAILANNGGVLAVFEDYRATFTQSDISIVWMSSAGASSFADGWIICGDAGMQTAPRIVSDGADGAFIAWNDARGADSDVYATRVNGTAMAVPPWLPTRAVSAASGDQKAIEIAADGSGGFVAVWEDHRTGQADIRAIRFDGGAAIVPGWPADGLLVCGATGDQTKPEVIADANGIQVCWEDERTGGMDIGMQRLQPNGSTAVGWPTDGLLVCSAAGDQSEPRIARDGLDGSYVVWLDARSGVRNEIYALRVGPDGAPAPEWPADGDGLAIGRDCSEVGLVDAGTDECLVVWRDTHSDGGDICVSRLVPEGSTPTNVPGLRPGGLSIRSWPNPATTAAFFAWELPAAQAVTIDIFDVRGRRVRTWAPGVLAAGAHRRDWNARDENGTLLPAGVYWLRVRGLAIQGTHKVVLTR